ncbi:tetratricopeptide repeat protein [Limisalsivibrio acetivorans]|uniref:tetratricopeptide repeat protein n=1 Tax=Limisalsivibrio acetivorans TaxID=1304888 RepID=UPI0003B3F9EA|nr:tetratricopeptide repeat protein [Limisalsivibrio acetivorans]
MSFIALSVISCSDEEPIKLLEDNYTEAVPISSVAVAEDDTGIAEGNRLFLEGNFEEAIELYEEGLKLNRSVAFYNIGVSYYLLDDIEKSEEYFRRAVAEDPEFTEAYVNLAVVLIQTGQLEEAEQYISELLEGSASAKLLVNMANIHLKRGETARATMLYDEAIKKDRRSKFVMSNYAYFLMSIGELESGIKILEGLDYKNYTDYFNLAKAYYKMGIYPASVDHLRKALGFQETEEALNLLAMNYNRLKDYLSEAEALERLTLISPTKEYLHRYAKALYRSSDFLRAKEVMASLIKAHPEDPALYLTYYDILIALNDIETAGRLAYGGFNRLNDDRLLYLYARHSLIYNRRPSGIRELIFSRPESDWVNLAKAMYHIYEGRMVPAAGVIERVSPNTSPDYFMYRTYILMKYNEYEDALRNVEYMDTSKPEYFWYKTVSLFNTRDLSALRNHISETLEKGRRITRHPEVAVHLDPVLEDMNFAYRFEGEFEQMLSAVLYPLLIEPDEMLNFVALGYKLLQQDDKLLALEELQKSVRFSEGIKHNNMGVELFLKYRYKDALGEFQMANEKLGTNPYTLYNIGLVHLSLGDKERALEFFDNSILQNRYNFPAYLGKAVCLKDSGSERDAMQQYNLVRDRAAQVEDDREKVPNIIYYTKYLAQMGAGDSRGAVEELERRNERDGFLNAMLALAEYISGSGYETLDVLEKDRIFRGAELKNLLDILNEKEVNSSPEPAEDRFHRFMRAYIYLKKHNQLVQIDDEEYERDKVILKELFYYNVFLENPQDALGYLQQLTEVDFRYPELYKASFYYFIWLEDFVNAEASFAALENLGYEDRYYDYYKMLYFLLNFNDQRLLNYIEAYMNDYPEDFRGPAMRLMVSLKNDNIRDVYNELLNMESKNGNFLLRLPLELEIDGL